MAELTESKDGAKVEAEKTVSTQHRRPSSPQHECRRTVPPCSPCKQLLRELGYSREADRFLDKGYINWMKACMVLQYAKEGMEVTAKNCAVQLHACIAKNMEYNKTVGNCPGCDIEKRRTRKTQNCTECTAWNNTILGHRRSETIKLNWSNTNLKNVKQKPWDLAKLFQGDGCQSYKGRDQCDILAILSFMSNCKDCVEYMLEDEDGDSDEGSKDDKSAEFHNLVTRVRDVRNEIFHSDSLKIVEETVLKEHIENVLRLLNYPKKLKEEITCKDKIQKIEWVRDNKIVPAEQEEQQIMDMLVSDMKGKKNSYERQLENATTAEEYKEIQEKLKKNEDTSRRLGVFVDMNLIDNPDVRQTLQSIEDECRKMYLEAERRLIETQLTPGQPDVVQNDRDQIELTWKKPEKFDGKGYYQIKYTEKSKDTWKRLKFGNDNKALLNDMKGDAGLIFKVRLVTGDVVGPYSEASDDVWTQATAGNALLDKNKLFKDNCPPVYTVPMITKTVDGRLRQYEIGSSTISTVDLHIWIFGETGSIRTAVIDNMLNFIVGINWDDDYRFTVKHIDCDKTDQTSSNENDFIANYIIYPAKGSRINHVVSIMDIPTLEGNISKDNRTFDQIYEMLKGRKVGVICVLVKAHESKMNAIQVQSVEAILSLFGNDLKYNICALLICSDEMDSKALQTNIKSDMALDKCFVFSNAGLTADHTAKRLHCRDLWRSNWEAYIELFQFVRNADCQTTEKSIEVMEIRKSITGAMLSIETNATEMYPYYEQDDGDGDDVSGFRYAIGYSSSDQAKCCNHNHKCSECRTKYSCCSEMLYCYSCYHSRPRSSYKSEKMKQHRTKFETLRKNINTLKQDIKNSKQEIKCSTEKLVQIALHP